MGSKAKRGAQEKWNIRPIFKAYIKAAKDTNAITRSQEGFSRQSEEEEEGFSRQSEEEETALQAVDA